MSPTQRSLKHLREQGYLCAIVEHWDHFARKRRDLFGMFDLLCVREGETLAVQTTSGSNVSARVKKLTESELMAPVRKAGWVVHVHGWTRNSKGKYALRTIDLS